MGNLSYDVTREELIETFSAAGKVLDAKVPTDRETGRPRGFAFVEFEDDAGAQRSIELLNGKDMKGRPLRVNEADNRPPRPLGAGGPAFRPAPRGDAPRGRGNAGGRFADPFAAPPLFPELGRKEERGRKFKNKGAEGKPKEGRRQERRRHRDFDDDDYDY